MTPSRRRSTKIAFTVLAALSAPLLVARAQAPIAITHVSVIDGTTPSPRADQTVIVTGNRITTVAPSASTAIPAGARTVDGRGKYLVPGFWDMHVHTEVPGGRGMLALFVANGVTGVRDMGSDFGTLQKWRAEIARGTLVGPRMIVSGPYLEGGDAHIAHLDVRTPEQARVAVDSLIRLGVDFVKIHTQLKRDVYFAAAREARARGIPFAGHLPGDVTAAEASDSGQKSLDHLLRIPNPCTAAEAEALKPKYPIQRVLGLCTADTLASLYARFVRNGTWIVPTFSAQLELALWPKRELPGDAYAKYLPDTLRKFVAFIFPMEPDIPPDADITGRALFEKRLAVVGAMHRAGVGILAGTDYPLRNSPPGFGLHGEFDFLARAGLSPFDILRAATIEPARYFGMLDSMGTVAPGKLADLVLLDASPLVDIRNAREISAVVANGRLFDAAARQALLQAAIDAGAASAQGHEHQATHGEQLGTVHFANSCSPAVAAPFDRGVTLMHSFEFPAAVRSFNEVLAADSTCAIAAWGIALSRWTNPMVATLRTPAALERGRVAATEASRLAPHATARERQYIGAVNQLYADYEHKTQRERQVAYEKAMADVAASNPADTEAKIFYAIALVASAPPTDKTYGNQLKAGAMLEALWKKQPNHPGLAHYIIHAYDVPGLAAQAQSAADRYADIAPSASHALHMPSHTFTRVGQWQKSVNTNLRSVAASRAAGQPAEALHADDYMIYAYLQMRQDAKAKEILDGLPAIVATLDPNAVTGAAPGSAGIFAIAAMPARYVLERRAWGEAAALVPKPTTLRYPEAMTHLTRALGAAHTGALPLARSSCDSLEAIQKQLAASGDVYWAEQVAIQVLEARAALRFAEGKKSEAMSAIAEAAAREDATEKSSVTPGPLVPAHELYGDILMEAKQPADALREYRKSLAKEPNRYRSLNGAMTAATLTGNAAAAGDYRRQIAKLTGQ